MLANANVKILVVDDIKGQYIMIRDFLSMSPHLYKYDLEWAATYDAALEATSQVSYDVCLVDYNLGDRSGLDLLLEIRMSRLDTVLILMTGEGSHELDLEAMQTGAIDYIDKTELKPVSLERTIRYAVNQQRALRKEQEQRYFAEALLDTLTTLNSTLRFDEVLQRILGNIGKVIPHDTANIMLIQEDGYTKTIGYRDYSSVQLEDYIRNIRFFAADTPSFAQMMRTQEPLLVADVHESPDWILEPSSEHLRSYLGAPIVVDENVIGFINLDSLTPGFFLDVHVGQLQAFANHAAIAIQNARSYGQAKELAAMEERQRLARDLHDAVSQTLFSANVMAESLPFLWEQDPNEALEYLPKLARLTKGALAEMRALLLELRPSALAETDFHTLLHHLIRAFESRTEAVVTLSFQDDNEATLSVTVKIALYRITQEVLNNITKHTQASTVGIEFHADQSRLQLVIQDNGPGFDQDSISSDHMGLRIMRERAVQIGADLDIDSQPGRGTKITVIRNEKTIAGSNNA